MIETEIKRKYCDRIFRCDMRIFTEKKKRFALKSIETQTIWCFVITKYYECDENFNFIANLRTNTVLIIIPIKHL